MKTRILILSICILLSGCTGYYNISGPARPAKLAKKTTAVKLTDNSQSKDFGMCMFSWQTAKDGSKCGKRATSVRESRRSMFSE